MTIGVLFKLALFDPDNTLITMLEKSQVEFQKLPVTQKFVVATDKTIEINKDESNEGLIDSIASILISWLKDKPYRKLQVQLIDGSIVYINDNNVEETKNILSNSIVITAFDPEYNNRIMEK